MRNVYYDNSRAILIFLVVLCHFIIWKGELGEEAIWLIYSFHMPAFIFISGIFSRKETWKETWRKSFVHLIIPYVFFQSLYNYITFFWLDRPIQTNYALPNFTLWFLLAMVFWKFSLQVIIRWKWTLILFLLVYFSHRFFILDLRYLSIGRAITFLPFFLLGYACKPFIEKIQNSDSHLLKQNFLIKSIGIIGIFTMYLLHKLEVINIPVTWFYGFFYPMDSLINSFSIPYLITYQVYVTIFSLLMIFLFFMVVPKNQYNWTHIGQHTLTIYLLHGFVRHWLVKEGWLFANNNIADLLALAAFSMLVTYVLSRKPFNQLISFLNSFLFIKK